MRKKLSRLVALPDIGQDRLLACRQRVVESGRYRTRTPYQNARKSAGGRKRGTESGTLGGDLGFSDAVAAVMSLPLSDAEKAEAIRRLLRIG